MAAAPGAEMPDFGDDNDDDEGAAAAWLLLQREDEERTARAAARAAARDARLRRAADEAREPARRRGLEGSPGGPQEECGEDPTASRSAPEEEGPQGSARGKRGVGREVADALLAHDRRALQKLSTGGCGWWWWCGLDAGACGAAAAAAWRAGAVWQRCCLAAVAAAAGWAAAGHAERGALARRARGALRVVGCAQVLVAVSRRLHKQAAEREFGRALTRAASGGALAGAVHELRRAFVSAAVIAAGLGPRLPGDFNADDLCEDAQPLVAIRKASSFIESQCLAFLATLAAAADEPVRWGSAGLPGFSSLAEKGERLMKSAVNRLTLASPAKPLRGSTTSAAVAGKENVRDVKALTAVCRKLLLDAADRLDDTPSGEGSGSFAEQLAAGQAVLEACLKNYRDVESMFSARVPWQTGHQDTDRGDSEDRAHEPLVREGDVLSTTGEICVEAPDSSRAVDLSLEPTEVLVTSGASSVAPRRRTPADGTRAAFGAPPVPSTLQAKTSVTRRLAADLEAPPVAEPRSTGPSAVRLQLDLQSELNDVFKKMQER
ncbi:hypothetical protein DIPPA_07338 [Diplonema papillatum]|nr:hypothetical protein DIPPA_07338 [Diplonema papillatum]|eukprot:gene1008-1544_t